jgi:hypothetical protein
MKSILFVIVGTIMLIGSVSAAFCPFTGYMQSTCSVNDGYVFGNMGNVATTLTDTTSISSANGFVFGTGNLAYTSAINVNCADVVSGYNVDIGSGRVIGGMSNVLLNSNFNTQAGNCTSCDEGEPIYFSMAQTQSSFDMSNGIVNSIAQSNTGILASQFTGVGNGMLNVEGSWNAMTGNANYITYETMGSNEITVAGINVGLVSEYMW